MTSAAEIATNSHDDEGYEDSYEDDTDVVSFCHDCGGYDLR
jgi:hypothetical protein